MLIQEIIIRKRSGGTLTPAEIDFFVAGLTDGSITEGQVAALAMAVCFQGMELPERVRLTEGMRDSGDVLTWDLPGPVIDKHSTGGVGDNVSLMLAPAWAACGVYVPMISGRGLGHTGGTLDKLSAIPGYDVAPGVDTLRRVVAEVGCAVIGQTAEVAPADKRFYGIRDVTGTVESVDLITASILSKKLAAGLEGLVLDVKWGNGAFMATAEDARALAQSLVAVANGAGCKTSAVLTDMNEPLASAAGNAIEVSNAVRFLTGEDIDARLWDVTIALGAEGLVIAGVADTVAAGKAAMAEAFQSGKAADKFAQMVAALGGPTDFMDRHQAYMPLAPVILDVTPETPGLVQSVNAREVGLAVVALGGGRVRAADDVDTGVGLDHLASIGAVVDGDFPLARIYARTHEATETAAARIRAAYQVGPGAPETGDVILDRVGPEDV